MRRVKGEASFTSCSNLVFCLQTDVAYAFITSTPGLEGARRQRSRRNTDHVMYKSCGTVRGGGGGIVIC